MDPRAERIRAMFDHIAGWYDPANTIFSLHRDAAWRRHAADLAAVPPGGSALDLCTGTGKLARELHRRGARDVIGLDFSEAMLQRARRRYPPIHFERGDATALPYPTARFHAVTMAFGIRNIVDRGRALQEAARVLKPGGRCVVLEFARPAPGPLAALYDFYLARLMPALGAIFDRKEHSYRYLADTITAFPKPEAFADEMRRAGFGEVGVSRMTVGIVAFYCAQIGGTRG